MPKFFVNSSQIKDNIVCVIGQDVNHITNVLRLNINDKLDICDTSSKQNYICKIVKIYKEKIECKIIEKNEKTTEADIELTMYQGIPKGEKMELIIQKSTELGVKNIVPVKMVRCIAKIESKNETKKLSRWQKIAEVAAKQSGRDIIPKIENIVSIKELCSEIKNYDIVLVAYEGEHINKLRNELKNLKHLEKENMRIAVVIGPEGGIEKKEINALKNSGAKIITLGKRILRTETVCLTLASIIMYELEQM